jgi:hypothetical protein
MVLQIIFKITRFLKKLAYYLSCSQTWLNPPMDGYKCDYIAKLEKKTLFPSRLLDFGKFIIK